MGIPHRVAPAVAGVVSSIFAGQPAFSQQPLAPVVVTASRIEQGLVDAIPHTTVITAEDIRNSQALDLPSLLRREAGFEYLQNGGIGANASLFLRGGDSRQTLFLVDGVRIESATTGAAAIHQLMLTEIDRIEIVRGNVSSLYGAGAVGGVVQIFTRQGRGPVHPQFEVTAGARDTTRVRAGVGGEVDRLRFHLNVSGLRVGGFSSIDTRLAPAASPDRDGFANLSGSGTVAFRIDTRHEVGMRAFRSDSRIDFDNAFAARVTDEHRADTVLQGISAWTDNHITGSWRSRLTLSRAEDRSDNFTNGARASFFNTGSNQVTWHNTIALRADHALQAGVEWMEQTVGSSTAFTRSARTVQSAFGGYNGRIGAHQVQANLRHDRYSDFGTANTWLAGYGYDLAREWKLTAMASTAFAAPSFNLLFFPGFSNPNLKPERTRSKEVGIQYAGAGRIARLVYFRTDYADLVVSPAPAFVPLNLNTARVDGVEATASGNVAGFDLRGSLTLQDPWGESINDRLLRRARTLGSLGVGRQVGAWRLGGDLLVNGTRRDTHITTGARVEQGGFALVNLTARYDIDKAWYAAVRLENALDRTYQTIHGFNQPPRGLYASLGWSPR
jgi:vitamin B12 transporter